MLVTDVVTQPYVDSGPSVPGLVGFIIKTGPDSHWFWSYLENVADELEAAGWQVEANQVRNEIKRLKLVSEGARP